MEYLVIDTGKLYHHKMRLDSILRKSNVNRVDVLNYIKNKHHLYFISGKVKDVQLLKFIDKVLGRYLKNKSGLGAIKEESPAPVQPPQSAFNHDDDFDYLNDDDEYEEDYEDYEEPYDEPPAKPEAPKQPTVSHEKAFNKNTFLTYCKEYEDSNDEEGGAEWDLDMDDDADFV